MIQSSKAITLVLISAASVLVGYHAFEPQRDEGADEYFDSTTRPSGTSGYHSGYYYGHHSGGSGFWGSGNRSFSGGSGSSVHGTSHGGFGGSGHAAGS